ncbi:MAG TPA: cytochrome c3 family protein [Firmicutes bacterium]|nr:cytochrome c3 family protein [Bacillota bacterium]
MRLILIALILLITVGQTVAAASIVGSYHDLSWINQTHLGTIGWQFFDDYNEVCVYCHTPHHANQAAGPLWNRATNTTTFQLYTSGTLDAAPNQPGPSSRLCLSCHDGTVAVDAILNAPPPDADDKLSSVHGKMVKPWQQSHVDCSFCHSGVFGDFSGSFFGGTLADEHPVGISYTSAPDLVEAPGNGLFPNGIKLIDGKVECASCHNVHDPGIPPFLRTSNAGSALCYTCHKK